MDLGLRIREWLRVTGLTQKDLAARVGVSPGAVSAWVNGDSAPTHKNLELIVGAFGISIVDFYGRIPKTRRTKAAA